MRALRARLTPFPDGPTSKAKGLTFPRHHPPTVCDPPSATTYTPGELSSLEFRMCYVVALLANVLNESDFGECILLWS